jgi:hypothetical protein
MRLKKWGDCTSNEHDLLGQNAERTRYLRDSRNRARRGLRHESKPLEPIAPSFF